MSKSNININLYDLNDDCLISIFDECDVETLLSLSDTCRRFKELIIKFNFPKVHTYVCELFDDNKLNSTRRIINSIGKYLKELTFDIRHHMESYDEDESDTYLPLLKEFAKDIGDNLRKFCLDVERVPNNWIVALSPIFAHLEILIIQTNNDHSDYDFDVCSISPKLKHLRIQGDYPMEENCQKWNCLESVSIGDNECLCSDTIVRLMSLNPQIKRFKVAAFNCDLHVGDIAEHLPNLEELVIFQNDSDLSGSTVHQLQRLKKLRNLRLMRIYPDEYDAILAGLPALSLVRALKIQLSTDYYDEIRYSKEHLISIARNIENLEEFSISNCPIDAKTVLDFVQFADNMKILHIHYCTIEVNIDLIREIGQLRLKSKKGKNIHLKVFSNNDTKQVIDRA